MFLDIADNHVMCHQRRREWEECLPPWITPELKRLIATFTNEEENEDEDWHDRLGPGTRTLSTAVLWQETKTFSKPVTVRGRVSSYTESHQGKCLSKNFVTFLYFSTAMKLFPIKSFCYFTIWILTLNVFTRIV